MKLLKAKEVKAKLKVDILKAREQLDIVNKAVAHLGKMEGKKITARVIRTMKVELNALHYIVTYTKEYGAFRIDIWGGSIKFGNSIRLRIGYVSDPVLRMVDVLTNAQCYFKNEEYIEKAIKAIKKIPIYVKQWNEAVKNLERIEEKIKEDGIDHVFPILNVRGL
jgi:hypothetical protein